MIKIPKASFRITLIFTTVWCRFIFTQL